MIETEEVKPTGFTLFEILVAVMIFGIIMLTIFSSFRSFIKSSYFIKDKIAASEVIASITNVMVRDFISLRISLPPEYSKKLSADSTSSNSGNFTDSTSVNGNLSSTSDSIPPSSLFDNSDDKDKFRFFGDETAVEGEIFSRVRFASLAHIAFGIRTTPNELSISESKSKSSTTWSNKPSGVARIFYYVRPNDEDGFDLCRSDTLNRFDDTEGTSCDPIICKNITKFKLTYMDIKGDEHTEWDSESDESEYSTPVSVRVEIEFKVIDSVHKFLTQISMPLFRTPLKNYK
ncbi:MAG: type II secretion system protein [Desulfamplus sp.]|nr:type II secretion system protein [Desulfamplus sp.]